MKFIDAISRSGLSITDLATRSGLEPTRLEALLTGKELPTVLELRRLADALGLSTIDFVEDEIPEPEPALLFRSTVQKSPHRSKAPVDSLTRKVSQAFELLQERGGPPQWIVELRPVDQSQQGAENLSEKFREFHFGDNQLSPLATLPSIAVERLGILVYLVDGSEFEGSSALLDGAAFIFLARRTFPARMLFTLAHEVGHLIAHHDRDGSAVLDVENDQARLRGKATTDEGFADAFASSLLLPRAGVGIALQKFRERHQITHDAVGDIEILFLARFFGVSFQVAARRCEDLQLLPRGGGQALYERIVKEHKNPERYADELGIPARPEIRFPAIPPRLLMDAVEGIRSGRVSIGRASSILNLSISDIFSFHATAWQSR